MKTYKSSDLTHKRAEVLKEAKANGVIIQECNTNGDVRCEYVLRSWESVEKEKNDRMISLAKQLPERKGLAKMCIEGSTFNKIK